MKPTMATGPLTDVVSSQYERWMYPEPILDLPGWLAIRDCEQV